VTLGLLLLEGRPTSVLAMWGLLITASGLVAVQASYFYARMKQARTEAEAHRREAQEALAAIQARDAPMARRTVLDLCRLDYPAA